MNPEMASFHNLNHPLANLLAHPVHTNIFEPTKGIRALSSLIDDPWYTSHLDHRFKNREGITTPDFDVREAKAAYFLEGNFAGIKSTQDIKIEWVGNRTLVIEADIEREDLEEVWGVKLGNCDCDADELRKTGNGNGELHQKVKEDKKVQHHLWEQPKHNDVRAWLSERHLGPMQRSFTFPRDVAADGLRAKLRNGMLMIMVPKVAVDKDDESRKRIVIEE